MLQLGTGMRTIEGVTLFPDHADERQFWYLPANIALARRPEDDRPAFTFIKYKRAATAEGVQGGGFLMFAVELGLSEDAERAIRSEIPPGARLSAAPFDSGTVECVALNLQGPGGTVATVGDDGTFVAVQRILGAQVPSLFGKNQAVFSLTLSQEGATLLEAAFAQGATPIGVIYQLTFTAMQPSLDVKITADFERIYEHFSAGLNANVYYVEIGIEAGLEELVQNGAIKIEVTNFSTDDDKAQQEKDAIDFFKQHLLQAWFTPTLTPGSLQGGMASAPRAGGGAALFGPGAGSGSGSGGGAASGRPRERPTPPAPPPPPPVPGGSGGPTPPPVPGGSGGPTPPPVPGGSGGPTPPPVPGGSGGPTPPPVPGGSGGPTPPPVPGGSGGPTPPPTPGPSTRELFVHFVEQGGMQGVHGRYTIDYEVDGTAREATTLPGASSQLRIEVPSSWTGSGIGATAESLPVLTTADADQLRALFAGASGILASGQREAPLGTALGRITAEAGGSAALSMKVVLPTTKTTVSASSADALVAAVFPGGRLVNDGIYDCRRISGTNNFELISVDWPGAFETTGGGQ